MSANLAAVCLFISRSVSVSRLDIGDGDSKLDPLCYGTPPVIPVAKYASLLVGARTRVQQRVPC